jgi:hypothetical protein
MIPVNEQKTGVIIAILTFFGILFKYREAVRVAIIASRIKEGNEIRMMIKDMIRMSEEIQKKDVQIAALVIRINQLEGKDDVK